MVQLCMMSQPKKVKLTENETDRDTFTESKKLLDIENELCIKLDTLEFQSPIQNVYNPLKYAKVLHETFVMKYFEHSSKKIMFLGMNPGPWGMCQNGIFFGEKNFVKNWLKITGTVDKPENEHPKRKVVGLDCHRSEMSGKKFWSFMKQLCDTPENFFKHSFVYNYCPLAFVEASAKNITPPEIKDKETRKHLIDTCDEALIKIIKEFNVEIVISIGEFTKKRALKALKALESIGVTNVKVCQIPHPSPRNAKNLKNWEQKTFSILKEYNLLEYFNEDPNLDEAIFVGEDALKNGEVPVGCIFIYKDSVIAKGANTVNETKNATRHAEMNCIDEVLSFCKEKNLSYQQVFSETEVVVTVEPCIMCSAALHELNIKQIIYGCGNYRFGGCSSVFDVPKVYNSISTVKGGIFAEEAITLLKEFYKGTNPNAPKSKVKKKKNDDSHNKLFEISQ